MTDLEFEEELEHQILWMDYYDLLKLQDRVNSEILDHKVCVARWESLKIKYGEYKK